MLLSVSPPIAVPQAWWRWINDLALDAVAVALAWLAVFAQMTGARLELVEISCLGTLVWLVYLGDRLLDARTGEGKAARHQFAWKKVRVLLPVMMLMASGALWWALHSMRWITLLAGFWVGGAVVLYFGIVLAARKKSVSQVLLIGISGLLVMGLVRGEATAGPGVQLWRAVIAGIMATVLYVGLRHHYSPPPWVLIKKWLGGYLFAVGVAVVPFSHLEDWLGLLCGAPVMLFASACALNSLGIRLWENEGTGDPELVMLRRLYPWLLAAVTGGAMAQAWVADEWSRPAMWGVAGCVLGLGGLHLSSRWPAAGRALAADGLMVAVALVVRWAGVQHL